MPTTGDTKPQPSREALDAANKLWLNGLHGARCEHGPYQKCQDCQLMCIVTALDAFAARQREQVERERDELGKHGTTLLRELLAARAEVERLQSRPPPLCAKCAVYHACSHDLAALTPEEPK